MEMLSKAVQIVLSVFIMVGMGFGLTHLGWLTKEVASLFSRLVTNIALPCMTIYQLLTQYTRESLLQSIPALGLAYLSVLLCYLLSFATQWLFRIPKEKAGSFRALSTFGNTIFIGLPINLALFGEAALPPTLMFYMANTSLFWVLGAFGIRLDGEALKGNRARFDPAMLKKLLTLPLLSFVLCAGLIMLGLTLPPFILDATKYVGNMVTPLSLFFIGNILYGMVRTGLVWQKGYAAILFSRAVLSPMLMLGLMSLLGGLPPLWQNTYLIQASMPTQSSCAIVAHQYGADTPYVTGAVTLTTLVSMVTIPIYAILTAYL